MASRDYYMEELRRAKSRRMVHYKTGARRNLIVEEEEEEDTGGGLNVVTKGEGASKSEDDTGGGDTGHAHHGGKVPFYAPPLQRQRWGEDQVLPHVNWGDIFFDLFYVAAAYNLGSLIISFMTPDLWLHGVIYFIGIFGTIFNIWESKVVYDARYTTRDYVHRLVDVARVFLLSLSVLHIKPLDLMADPRSAETFGFCLGLFLECLVRIGLQAELITVGRGDVEAIRHHTKRLLVTRYVPQAVFYGAAVTVAAMQLFNSGGKDDSLIYEADENAASSLSEYGSGEGYGYSSKWKEEEGDSSKTPYDDNSESQAHRFLAPSSGGKSEHDFSPDWSVTDIPILICFTVYVLDALFTLFREIVWLPTSENFKSENIPLNIDFCIHRYGEWTMLMLGESVLSLLIVTTTESQEYYFVATFGVLTVILLQVLRFESEPSHAGDHALWRSMQAGVVYSYLMQILSMSLIAFGVAYKVMLKTIHKVDLKKEALAATSGYGDDGKDDYGGRRWLLLHGEHEEEDEENPNIAGLLTQLHRRLGGSVSVSERATAALFCGSLAIILLSSELIINSHIGFRKAFDRMVSFHCAIVVLDLVKLGLVLFVISLGQWMVSAKWITLAGFFVVLAYTVVTDVGGTLHAKWDSERESKLKQGEGVSHHYETERSHYDEDDSKN